MISDRYSRYYYKSEIKMNNTHNKFVKDVDIPQTVYTVYKSYKKKLKNKIMNIIKS